MSANPAVPFDQLIYKRADYETIVNTLRRSRLRLRLAPNIGSASQAIQDMQGIMRNYHSQAALARIRHDRQTDDPFYTAEQDYYDQTDAQVTQLTQLFYTTMLGSHHRKELEQQFGSLIFRKAMNLREIIKPAAVEDLSEENRLSSAYMQKMSDALIQLDGHDYTVSQLEPLQESPDRLIRKKAHEAQADWLDKQSEELDQLFEQLVSVRTRISRKLGYATFTELGYKRMERFDYKRSQVESLRQSVVRYIVPITREIRHLQRRRLNLEHLKYYDLPCLFPSGNPTLVIPPEELPLQAELALGKITRQEPSFFKSMIDGGFLDLESRANKAPGGYCSTVFSAGMPFILMNANGTAQDAATLLHEAGHAYASHRSLADLNLLEYHSPTLETCEIHSTALEYLSYPQMDRFFGVEAENYTMMHMTEALLFIPYGCMVDEFQHIIYDQPRLTPAERHQVWRDLENTYMPDLDYGQEPFYVKGGAWQKKGHIYVAPFYYIDYVLAQLVALDLWQLSRKSPDKAWRRYDKLCSLGGRETFLKLLAGAELESPFESGLIKRLAYAACDFLDL